MLAAYNEINKVNNMVKIEQGIIAKTNA